jgi:hypothetical protein
MTESHRRVLASTSAQEREGTPGPTPAVYEAPAIASRGPVRGPRSSRCSHAPSPSLTASIRAPVLVAFTVLPAFTAAPAWCPAAAWPDVAHPATRKKLQASIIDPSTADRAFPHRITP